MDTVVGDADGQKAQVGTRRAGMEEELRFVRQLLVKLRAGLSPEKCLAALAGETKNGRLRAECKEMHAHVAKGASLSLALRRQSIFDAVVVRLVELGEETGQLKSALTNVVDYLERIGRLRRAMRGAVAKPLNVLSLVLLAIFIATVALSFLVKEVLPEANAVHRATLSVADLVALKVSEVVRVGWPYVGVFGALCFSAIYLLPRFARTGLEVVALKLPLLAATTRATALACFTRTVAILMRSGAILGEAMGLAALTADRQFMRDAIVRTVGKIEKGKPYIEAMAEDGLLRRRDSSAIQAAERRGDLAAFMLTLADDREREAVDKLGTLRSVVHTTVAVLLGLALLAVLLGLYVPVFVSR